MTEGGTTFHNDYTAIHAQGFLEFPSKGIWQWWWVGGGDQNLRSLARSFHDDQINRYKEHSIYGSKLHVMQVKADAYRIGPQAAFYRCST